MTATAPRLMRQPTPGMTIDGPTGPVQVHQVTDHGRTLYVLDTIGRGWMLTRAAHGWWTILEEGPTP